MQARSKRLRLAHFSPLPVALALALLPNSDVARAAPPAAAAPVASGPGLLFAHEPVVDRLDN
ncbi:MAG: hypothetical protein ABI183_07405, partial [Polyangiaceae bacterium]